MFFRLWARLETCDFAILLRLARAVSIFQGGEDGKESSEDRE